MNSEELYKLANSEVEKIKEQYWPAKEGSYVSRDIEITYSRDKAYQDKADILIYSLKDYPQENIPKELKISTLSESRKEYCLYKILHYRLSNIIPYIVKGWEVGDWNSCISEYIRLYNKYNRYDKTRNN